MQVYLTHGIKDYDNKIGHDSPLTEEVNEILIKKVVERVLDSCLPPSVIYCSPYLRCYQTAVLVIKELEDRSHYTPYLFFDNELSEFLGNQTGNIKVTKETIERSQELLYGTDETVEEFKKRVEKWKFDHKNDEGVWIIGHRFFASVLSNGNILNYCSILSYNGKDYIELLNDI